jgi:hypothetical protein
VKRTMIALLLTVTSADAHSWYPRECCSDQHCFPVPCNELHNNTWGVEWHHRVSAGRRLSRHRIRGATSASSLMS